MPKTKAPKNKQKSPLDPESESWRALPWRKFEQHVYRIQKRIFRAEQRGNTRAVHSLQRLLMKSKAARLLAVRRVTQENQEKKTAGVDGVKSVPPAQRFELAERIHPKYWKRAKTLPVRRVYIPKPGKNEMRPLGIPVMKCRSMQALYLLALDPVAETLADPHSYGFRPGRSPADAIEQCFKVLGKQASPQWILEGDIKGCFDHAS